MKNILFVIDSLTCGGAEKSLVSLLNNIDYSKYNVDLLLFKRGGEFEKFLPSKVNLLEIPDYNVIVVSDEYGKYAFMDINGNDSILNFLFDEIYIKVSEGQETYWMTYRGNEYEVLKYLKQSQGAK